MAKYISLDSIDGAGKTTAVKYLVSALKSHGARVLETREVGNPHVPSLLKLRELILSPTSDFNGVEMEFIFAAMGARNARHYDAVSEDYDFIVSDRAYLSHLAYTDVNVSSDFTDRLYLQLAVNFFKMPDYNIFLDAKPEVAWARVTSRGDIPDAIEKKGKVFQEQVYSAFQIHLQNPHLNVIRIDANGDIASVQKQLDAFVETLK